MKNYELTIKEIEVKEELLKASKNVRDLFFAYKDIIKMQIEDAKSCPLDEGETEEDRQKIIQTLEYFDGKSFALSQFFKTFDDMLTGL